MNRDDNRCHKCRRCCETGASYCLRCVNSTYEGCGHALQQGFARCELCNPVCENCSRQHTTNAENPLLQVVVASRDVLGGNLRSAMRRKFVTFVLGRGQHSIMLCEECHAYCSENNVREVNPKDVWPSFVWTVLRRDDLADRSWSFLPIQWRNWWLSAFSIKHLVCISILLCATSHFRDDSYSYSQDLSALDELRWTRLMERETSLVVPSVKCPVGCSEFKHRANKLPFDIIWEACLGTELDLMSKPTLRRFGRVMRKDYLTSDKILGNDAWLCKPTIVKTLGEPPVVLCCRHHSIRSKKQMIHPPTNPTGSLSVPEAGGLSPVVPIPRTIQKSKVSSYSASFQMSFMEGSYYGMDTMFLSTTQGIGSVNSNLGWKQDVLSYASRKDVRGYTRSKYGKHSDLPGSIVASLDNDAKDLYPYLDELKREYCQGASYVSLNDAVQLQRHIDFGTTEIALKKDDNNNIQRIQFKGRYPQRLVWSHPAVSKLGCTPPELPRFTSNRTEDTREAWLLSSAMLLVPELWNAVASVPLKKSWSWEGPLLTMLSKNFLPHITATPSNNPFPVLSEKAIVLKLFRSNQFNMGNLRQKFGNLSTVSSGIHCFHGQLPDVFPDGITVGVVTRDYQSDNIIPWNPPESVTMPDGKVFKLCYVAITSVPPNATTANKWNGQIYTRHSSAAFSDWWGFDRTKHLPFSTTLDVTLLPMWDMCVYVQCDSCVSVHLRNQILQSCGGQDKVYCREHGYPLITSRRDTNKLCSCREGRLPVGDEIHNVNDGARCNKKPMFCCAVESCASCICKDHSTAVQDWEFKFLVGQTCSYGNALVHPNLPLFDSGNDHLPFLDDQVQSDDDKSEDSTTTRVLEIPEMDDEGFEARFRLDDAMLDDVFVTDTMQGTDDLEDIDPVTVPDEEAAEDQFAYDLPSTNAGTLPVYTAVAPSDYSDCTINNHVLLNNFGHMLIRRNKKLTGTLNQQHFLQRLVSKFPGDSLPLAYPEGMLFSDIFFSETDDNAVIGSMPSAMLNCDKVLGSMGFSSLEDHYRSRLSHPGILTSSNPKYHLFAFDCFSNLSLRGCDSRVILSRGFAEFQKDGGVSLSGRKDRIFDSEQVDSRPVVNKLAAAIIEEPPTYFYTHTCSMRTHFGMKHLWDWITSDAALDAVTDGTESDDEKDRLQKNIIDGSGVQLLRSWMEVMQIWVNYITNSPEKPIGEVVRFLFRMELQDAKANLPHLHALLWTLDNLATEAGMEAVLDRIRGFILDIIRPDERERFKQDGVFENDDHVVRFMEMIQTFLTHSHSRRCFIRKKRKHGDTEEETYETVCKSNNNYRDNPWPSQHSFVELPIQHNKDATDILVSLGLARLTHNGKFVPLHHTLKAVKHYPPAHGDEGIIQPVFGSLTARNPNMGNVQFPSGYTLSRYLAKYIVMLDLYNTIQIKAPLVKGDDNTFDVHGRELPNQKITGNRLQNKEREGSARNPKMRHGRGFNVVEFYMMLFGYPMIMTNIDFVKITTAPFEERPARERVKPIDSLKQVPHLQHRALQPIDVIPSHQARISKNLPLWRQFTPSQIELIRDDLESPLTTNDVTSFSARPPELLFASRQCKYRRWFSETFCRRSYDDNIQWTEQHTNTRLDKSLWINGFGRFVQVRARAIPEVLSELRRQRHPWFRGYYQMIRLFEQLQTAVQCHLPSVRQTGLLDMFVCERTSKYLPITWYDSVRPTRTNRFLVHILLSMGYFRDEYELFTTPSLRHSFHKAGLLDPTNPLESCKDLVKEYVLSQLVCLPAGTITFDRYLVAAYQTILDLFVYDRLSSTDLPSVLYCRTRDVTEDKIVQYQQTKQRQLTQYILSKLNDAGVPDLPSIEACSSATISNPINWDPVNIPRSALQPEESYTEQNDVLRVARQKVHDYKQGIGYTRGICHVGAGGVGKTTVLLMELLYGVCQGLNVAITAMLSERAQELAGSHLHDLFAMPGRDFLSPGQLAERAIAALFRNPEKLEFLRLLDMLALDESGAIPCEILAAVCTILRYVRGNNIPFGGMLLLATLDHLQIDPVFGRHCLLSGAFTSCLNFRALLHSVRAALDGNWLRIQAITRMSANELMTNAVKQEFVNLFVSTVSFVRTLDDASLPSTILYVFGKKAPIRAEERRILREKQHPKNQVMYRISVAKDEERTIDGNFATASDITSKTLDSKVKEPRRLLLYEKGRYQITFNKQGVFSNSQIAILFDLPDEATIAKKAPIPMVVAPPGCRHIPDDTVTKDELLNTGWKQISIGTPRATIVHNASGSVRGRRFQYGLRHHIGSTIHGIMGQTLDSLLTRVERGGKKEPYSLWLASQVVVLLSRTRFGRQTYFWLANGEDPKDTAEVIYDLLCLTSPFRDYLTRMLKALCSTHNDMGTDYNIIDQSQHILRPRDIALPTARLGYVYLLVSTKDLSHIYIGSTYDLIQRWKKHNTGYGAQQTSPARLRPWAILAYISGFDGNKPSFTAIENTWIARKEDLIRDNSQRVSVQSILNAGKDIVAEHNALTGSKMLQFTSCGTIEILSRK